MHFARILASAVVAVTLAGCDSPPVMVVTTPPDMTMVAPDCNKDPTLCGGCLVDKDCSGATSRLVADDPITPTYGGIAGGFEVYINEGYAHVDVVTAEDDPVHNHVIAPLVAFLERNTP